MRPPALTLHIVDVRVRGHLIATIETDTEVRADSRVVSRGTVRTRHLGRRSALRAAHAVRALYIDAGQPIRTIRLTAA